MSLFAAGAVALPSAHAETTGEASAQVQALLKKVHHLQSEAKVAEGRYARAFQGLESSVDAAITADETSSAAASNAASAEAALDARVLALYESGGQVAADAAMLRSGTITEVFDRNELASRAVSAQVAAVRTANEAAAAAEQAARTAGHQEHVAIGTERSIASAATRVQSLLAAQSKLLRKADKRLAAVRAAEAELASETSDFSSITTSSIDNLHILPPSALYLSLYQGAAKTCPGLPWTVLAAIGQVESGHGRNDSTSSAGAMGPMQFLPATFAAYAVDGDHDGKTSIMDPADAIYTAAHYLCANGAGRSPGALRAAVFHYNHAVWYVDMVLKLAGMYARAYA